MKAGFKNIAGIIDHTNIKISATERDIEKTCQEARRYKFRGVCVNPEWVRFAKSKLKGTSIKVVCLIDPPMGLSPHSKRVEIAKTAKKDGADELDVVMNIIDMKYGRYDDILDDLRVFPRILPTKIIIGSGYLTDQEIKKASQIVKSSGAFCVKTATVGDPLEHIELKEKARHLGIMRQGAPGLKIKAAGRIRTFKELQMMVKAGADIIGTSSSIVIMKGCKRNVKTKNQKSKPKAKSQKE